MDLAPTDPKHFVLKSWYEDPVLCFRTALPAWFPRKIPWVHRGIMALVLQRTDFLTKFGTENYAEEPDAEWTPEELDLIIRYFTYKENPDDPESPELPLFSYDGTAVHLTTSRFMQVMMPRGFSKTTLFNALVLFCIVFRLANYIVYLSETAGHAEQQLGNIKREIESNEVLLEVVGPQAPERNDPEKWTGNYIEILNGPTVQALGRGGQVRGKNSRGRRPDIILLDDVEDKESVATPEQRSKTLTWLLSDVKPALPRRGGKIFILGTLLHADAMMMQIARDPSWVTCRFGAMLPDGSPLWRAQMTEKEWLRERKTYALHGQLPQFYMEYQSQIHVDADSRKFKTENMKVIPRERGEFVLTAMAMDPAISEKKQADAATISVVGMTQRGIIHLIDQWGKRGANPRELIDHYFRLHFLHNVDLHGVESIAYQAALIHLLQEEMSRASRAFGGRAFFAITPITHSVQKVARIEGILVPRYAAGYITHERRFPELESEALDWPNGKKDHLDSLAMAISLLDPVATIPAPEEMIDAAPGSWRQINEEFRSCP